MACEWIGSLVTPEQRFYVLLSIISLISGGMVFLFRLLWKVSTQWTRTGDKLQQLAEEIHGLVQQKEREHARLEKEDDRLGKRIERLENWTRRRA